MEISRHWRLQPLRYGTPNGGLGGSICKEGHVHFPPREICPECAMIVYHGLVEQGRENVEPLEFEVIALLVEPELVLVG